MSYGIICLNVFHVEIHMRAVITILQLCKFIFARNYNFKFIITISRSPVCSLYYLLANEVLSSHLFVRNFIYFNLSILVDETVYYADEFVTTNRRDLIAMIKVQFNSYISKFNLEYNEEFQW